MSGAVPVVGSILADAAESVLAGAGILRGMIGVFGMLLFHIIENICMVIGLLPVTGIPLPFVSYGGSNMLTNMMAIGLVENVVMRSRARERRRQTAAPRSIDL